MQEYNIPSILDETIALGAIVPNPQNVQLKALISQMVAGEVNLQLAEKDAEIDLLQSKIEELETRLEEHQSTTGRERAYDRQRIAKLETGNSKKLGSTGKSQIEEMVRYLKDFPGHMAPFEVVRQHIGVGKGRFGDLMATPEADDNFLVIRNPNDRRKRLLKLKPNL